MNNKGLAWMFVSLLVVVSLSVFFFPWNPNGSSPHDGQQSDTHAHHHGDHKMEVAFDTRTLADGDVILTAHIPAAGSSTNVRFELWKKGDATPQQVEVTNRGSGRFEARTTLHPGHWVCAVHVEEHSTSSHVHQEFEFVVPGSQLSRLKTKTPFVGD
ncbi:hypothetical protein [Brevibacillus thermoruber]|uniref:hypothetical protein n=1 Tax=Brevibacillus thermoruber TaxID=33942 RepID=UPI000416D3E3|nr:hypothetical protein [Brevibacillus thermoruber]